MNGTAQHVYELQTLANGRLRGTLWTNDDLGQGVPTQEANWDVNFASRRDALRLTGGTHTGAGGAEVSVTIDGRKVDAQGRRIVEDLPIPAPRWPETPALAWR